MRTIQAVFRCDSVVPAQWGYDAVAHLSAVADEDGKYKSYTDATPSGQLTIQISKDVPAHKFFQQGRHYQLDFTKIPLTKQEIKDDILTDEHELTFKKS